MAVYLRPHTERILTISERMMSSSDYELPINYKELKKLIAEVTKNSASSMEVDEM